MISVCLATYNGEKYIQQQLESIISQLELDDEIIVSDDGSNDSTLEIIRSFHDKRIKILEANFKNPTYNFENALNHAKGKYIFLADQDDIWMPEKLNTMIYYLQTYDLVLSDNKIIDKNGQKLHASFFVLNHSDTGIIHNIFKNSYIGCCMAFNRKILLKSLPFPPNIPMHDWWIGMIAESCGKPYFIHKPLVLYRRHSSNASESGEKSRFGFFKKFQFRYILIKNLIKRCLFNG